MAGTLLAASVLSDRSWQRHALHIAREILSDMPQCYLHVWAARRELSLSPVSSDLDPTNRVLESLRPATGLYAQAPLNRSNSRYNAQYGRLVVLVAQRLVQRNDHGAAKTRLGGWKPLDEGHPSTLERVTQIRKGVVIARISHLEGDFPEALRRLESLYQTGNENTVTSIPDLFPNLLRVYLELGRTTDVLQLLPRDSIDKRSDLKLLAAEALMQEDRYHEAEVCYKEVEDAYTNTDNLSSLDQLHHVWACIGLARIPHTRSLENDVFAATTQLDEALDRWCHAQEVVERYKWGQGFTFGIIHYSLCDVLAKRGHGDLSKKALIESTKILSREGRKYWMVNVATRWYDRVKWEVKELSFELARLGLLRC